jgi:hypothetical protein
MMMLREYIYMDEWRLNSYFEQLSVPVAYDKVSTWKVALGLTGPKAEATQSRTGRPFTTHEKVDKFLKAIKDAGLMASGRFRDPYEEEPGANPFRVETMDAIRVRLEVPEGREDNQLYVWVSLRPDSERLGSDHTK